MDLKTYEHLKFELADLIRAGELIASPIGTEAARRPHAERPWRDLLTRLAEDRFTVVVAGRFSQGKSSLMNAVLGLDRLPTGLLPLTSLITYVRYGTSERVLLDYERSGLRGEAKLAEIGQYVTEKGNPGNVKGIRSAEIQLPAEILRRGVFFVDTPGLGSAIFENSRTTESFIPEIDVLILVTSYGSPMTEDEILFLERASDSVREVFIVVNKQDAVPIAARAEVLDYVERTTRSVLGGSARAPFSLSARDALDAKQRGDAAALRESGIQELEGELVKFLTEHRAHLFLSSMCDRVLVEYRRLPAANVGALLATVRSIQQRIEAAGGLGMDHVVRAQDPIPSAGAARIVARTSACEVCRAVIHAQLDFLARYQYELSTRPEVQHEHARRDGFCPLHTWHYEQMASPRGVCTAYPALLNRVAERLRSLAALDEGQTTSPARLLAPDCPVCEVRRETETQTVEAILSHSGQSERPDRLTAAAFCLPHLLSVLRQADSDELRRELLASHAALMERLAEDLQRYAIRHDALRRGLASREEQDAPLAALQLLVGHKVVNATFTVQNIL